MQHNAPATWCCLCTLKPCPLCYSVCCRVHEAKRLQDGALYAVKVLPKATKKHKAREQLQSESTNSTNSSTSSTSSSFFQG